MPYVYSVAQSCHLNSITVQDAITLVWAKADVAVAG